MLYAQDEVGFLSDAVIQEFAGRVDAELDVRNVISYYSMLTTKPARKYNVQVCTNIACMLRGGEETRTAARNWASATRTTADADFTLEEVGACSWAPAVQVNYDFHENLTVEKLDKVLDECKQKDLVENW